VIARFAGHLRPFGWFTAALVLALVLLATPAPSAAQSRLTVVATTSMIADAAREVGGNHVEVRALMGPGIDPHAYRQTRSDIVVMSKADLVLWNGLYLEAQMEEFFTKLAAKVDVVAVAERLPRDRLLAHNDHAEELDPHIWMDPALWRNAVVAIKDALIVKLPHAETALRANAERYLAEIDALRAYAAETLASVPPEARVLVTAHDAFNYFGLAYGFEVQGIQGISTESEAGLKRIADLVDLLIQRKVGSVFVESSVSDRNVRALIEGAAARGHTVVIGGELFSDAMGEPGTYEGTYLGMIDHNATTIARSLGGEAPAAGMVGKLAVGRKE